MACRPYNTGRCLQLRLFNCPNFGVHFSACPHDFSPKKESFSPVVRCKYTTVFSDWTNISDKYHLVLRMTVTRFPEIAISFSRDLSYFFPRLQMRISGKTGKNLGKN